MTDPAAGLPRVLGTGRFALMIVGITIATAIFRVPSLIAARTGSPALAALIWAAGALFAVAGGLCAAELAARVPKVGGEYALIRAAYGDRMAFVFGWTWLVLVSPASIAAVARTFADYAAAVTPLDEGGRRLLTVAVIALHALLAMASTRLAARFIGGATLAKLLAMGLVVVVAFALPARSPAAPPPIPPGAGSAGALIAALVAVIWAYDGSSQFTLAGDVRDPARTIPRGLLLGVAIVVIIYVALNAAYLRALGFGGVAASTAVAADTAGSLLGRPGTLLLALLVMLSAYSCGMVQLVSHPRVTFALASDGFTFSKAAAISRSGTPWVAIVLHGAAAAVLALLGGYEFLVRLVVFAFYPMVAAAYLGAVVLRRRDGLPAGFRMPLYPLPVVVYVGMMVLVLAVSLVDDPAALVFASVVITAAWAGSRWRPAGSPPAGSAGT